MVASSIKIPGFDILRPLGSGGMSTVYLALQRSLDRKVAIKIMRRVGDDASAENQQAEKRFLLEGRMMAKLPHRNIVAVYDIVSESHLAYICMEYLGGGTLSRKMREGLSLSQAVAVVVQIASALEFAHGQNVIHRDLKPANIMFRDVSTPVLTDFGIARYQDGSATRLTQTGMMVGTPAYMSPEQINGEQIDGRADQYSLGILFYEMLAGNVPFRGTSPVSVLMAHLNQPVPPLPEEFSPFQPVLDRMLAKDRNERYPEMREFSQDLKARLIQSDTLLTRLELDPEQSSSEQLRALGFSMSSPDAIRSRDSLSRGQLPDLRSVASPAPSPGPRSASTETPVRWRIPMWRLAAVFLGVAMVATGAWLMFRGHSHLSKDQERVVQLLLEHAQQLVDKNALVSPPDENAYTYIQQALNRDPQNQKAQRLLDRIAGALGSQAQKALAQGQLDLASDLDNQARLVRPDDGKLGALAAQIEQARKAASVKARVDKLLADAEAARKAGRLIGADSAYSLLVEARSVRPKDAEVERRIDALVTQQLAAASKSLEGGDATAAMSQLSNLQPYLGKEPAFRALDARAKQLLNKQQLEKSLTAAISRGKRQLLAGHLTDPNADNAYETFGELGKLAPADPRVNAFGVSLAHALLKDAQALNGKRRYQQALERAGLALQIAPDFGEAQVLKQQIEQRLGARASKLAQLLGTARQAIAEQRFTPPAKNDADTALRSVLKIDAGNTVARQLLAELPQRIVTAAASLARDDANAAVVMVASARKVFPQNAALTGLAARLQKQLAAEKIAARDRAAQQRIEDVLSNASQTTAQLHAGVKDLQVLLADQPGARETQGLRSRLIGAIGSRIKAATAHDEFDALADLLKRESGTLSADASYAPLVSGLPALRTTLLKAEQARAAAERGQLVLNAYPWGRVESVLDANRKPVALPADRTTPLILTLPAGSYVVSFRHPKVGKAIRLIAKVKARERTITSAAFSTITAKDYFARAQ